MKEVIIIETSQPQQVKKLLEQTRINYKVYPNSRQSLFSNYGQVIQDKHREQEAQELENAEEEDIVDEEC